MRITQTMLSNNMLRNLNSSYLKMGKLQEQLSSGSKLTKPSDDPVASVKGMGYRTTLAKNEQYTRNMNEVNSWLDTTDTTLSEVNKALQRVKDIVTQAANDTNTPEDREAMQKEVDQLRMQIRDLANTQQGGKYLFSGTATDQPLFKDTSAGASSADAPPVLGGNNNTVEIEIYEGITFQINENARGLFESIDGMMQKVQQGLEGTSTDLTNLIGTVSAQTDKVLEMQAGVGAKQNRIDVMTDRLSSQKINVTKQISNNEDVEYEDTITQLITEESIHRAALSVGAKIIQPTLVDFL
ncbi:flagellar hook-associated protein FlgL [Kurthia gibsonii]|uniref:flagellar hook-associated protein FlgL n=1 Tax=Kurthia gibsonii TaxID=33946 RepID=UPI002DB960A4|nr:flagellar hook-associated protein FlgL [Kurthia gibsonii]MEB6112865.1 flagellar hook-associated protein FlgL [Kurthia gibsonii]